MNTPIRMPRSASVLTLFNPHRHTRAFLLLFSLGLGIGSFAVMRAGMPIWGATLFTLGLIAYPILQKWRDDLQQYGQPLMVLSILVALQGFHTVEHIAQWVQYHVFNWAPKDASGLISPLNAEVVHFVWNWTIVIAVLYLFRHNMRNLFGWLLLLWSLAHALEHTYLMQQYLRTVMVLWQTDSSLAFAQGQPGIFGSHGWLSRVGYQYEPFNYICQIAPGLVTTPRLDVHFNWNIGEFGLMLPYAHMVMRQQIRQIKAAPQNDAAVVQPTV